MLCKACSSKGLEEIGLDSYCKFYIIHLIKY